MTFCIIVNLVFTLSMHSSNPIGINPSTFCLGHFSNLYITIKYLFKVSVSGDK